MISFAQNFEDVILARIFRGQSTGFYVDVGAHYPLIDSVTEHFYRLGWRGINIEPLPPAFRELSRTRALDINLNVAIAETEGEVPFFALDGFSTLSEDVALRHGRVGLEPRRTLTQTRRLDTILSEHPTARIDFLKIDVEGAEGGVVRSNDWDRFRPSIVIIEAIDPQTQALCVEDWEKAILGAGYEVAHFDGVNRWYWNKAFPKPDASCFLPPNALDGFTTFAQITAEFHAATVAREAAYERDHSNQRMAKISEALTALAEGDYSTPAPNESLDKVWLALQELVQSASLPLPPVQIEEPSLQEPISEEILAEANHQIEELRTRLSFSEKARLVLAETLASRGISV